MLQKIADILVNKVKNSKDLSEAEYFFSVGIFFNSFCIRYFGLYLK